MLYFCSSKAYWGSHLGAIIYVSLVLYFGPKNETKSFSELYAVPKSIKAFKSWLLIL